MPIHSMETRLGRTILCTRTPSSPSTRMWSDFIPRTRWIPDGVAGGEAGEGGRLQAQLGTSWRQDGGAAAGAPAGRRVGGGARPGRAPAHPGGYCCHTCGLMGAARTSTRCAARRRDNAWGAERAREGWEAGSDPWGANLRAHLGRV